MHRLFSSRQDSIVMKDVPVKSFSMMNSIRSKNLSNFQNLIPSNPFDWKWFVQKLPTILLPKKFCHQNLSPKIFVVKNGRKLRKIGWIGGFDRNYIRVLTASCVELGGGETETGECSPEFDSSCSSPFNFRFSSKATRARQKLFSCSFIVERRGKRFPQYWQAKNYHSKSQKNSTINNVRIHFWNGTIGQHSGTNLKCSLKWTASQRTPMCVVIVVRNRKNLPKGFSPVWTRSCAKTSVRWMKALLQNLKFLLVRGQTESKFQVIWGHTPVFSSEVIIF